MKILVLNGILWTAEGGVIEPRDSIADCMISTFARGLVHNGHQVTLVAAEQYRPRKSEDLGFDVVYLPTRWPSLFKPAYLPWMPSLTRYLRQHRDEIDLIVSSEAFSLMSWQAARVAPEKLVVWQEMYMHQRKFFTLASRLWHNLVVRSTVKKALMVPRSDKSAQFIAQYAPRVAAEWVDHGADAERFYPADSHDRYFIVVARLVPGKRVDRIIDKFARLLQNQRYADYRLELAGDGPEREALEQQAARLGIADRVSVHGYLPHNEMASLLRRATAMLVDTAKDLNMVSIPEAIASGTPIVTNSLPANSPFITRHNLGIVDDNWDSGQLADIIENYDQYHKNCVAQREHFTNYGTTRLLVELFATTR